MSSGLPGNPWHLMSARDVVQALKVGKVTPLELIDVVEARLKETDGLLHTTPITCFERARKAVHSLIHPESPKPGYLYGLPILIKDDNAVSGVRYTEGSPLHRNRIPEFSSPIVIRLEEMGGIVVGKTNTPEFMAGSHSFNTLFETTRSPYDIRTSAGGSSGGSAAALAGTQIWLATGSDLGGSLRIPAAFCGVVGFRCTPGRIPRETPVPGSTHESKQAYYLHGVSGPMARGVQDLALFLDAMTSEYSINGKAEAGWEEFAIPPPLPYLNENDRLGHWQAIAQRSLVQPRNLRIGFSTLGLRFSDDVVSTCRAAANILANTMYTNSQSNLPTTSDLVAKRIKSKLIEIESPFDLSTAERCFYIIRSEKFHKGFTGCYTTEEISTMKPEIQWNINSHLVADSPNKIMKKVLKDAENLFKSVNDDLFTDKIDILVTPATLDASFDQKYRYPTKEFGQPSEDDTFKDYLKWMMPSCLISATSSPALVLPAGKLNDGRPVGVQLVGKWGSDATVLEAAAVLESKLKLQMHHGLSSPICGSSKLNASGPISEDEAAEHHKEAIDCYRNKYVEL